MSDYGDGPILPGAFAPREEFDLGRYRLAGMGPASGAWVIDALIIVAIFCVLFVPLVLLVPVVGGSTGGIVGIILAGLFAAAVFCVACALYAPLVMTRWNGQTVGKRALGLRVIKTDGEPMDLGSAFVRESVVKWLLHVVVGMLTFAVLPLIDYLWPLWDDEHRALHDFLCATRVVET